MKKKSKFTFLKIESSIYVYFLNVDWGQNVNVLFSTKLFHHCLNRTLNLVIFKSELTLIVTDFLLISYS